MASTYSIGQVSEMFGIPVSTLRFYDKEGLFPNLARSGNIRQFGADEIELIRVIECLKKSGLEIKDIKRFVELVNEGPSSYGARKELFEERREAITQEMERLQKTLAMIQFKCWYYDKAVADGNEDGINAMLPDQLPAEIQALYDKAHE